MDTKSQRILNIYETGVSETELTETLKTKINASTGGSLGSIKPTDAAPTPARNGNYTFSIGGNKPAWLTAEAGITEVKAGDGVSVVYDGVSAYTYTHVKIDMIADVQTKAITPIEGMTATTVEEGLGELNTGYKANLLEIISLSNTKLDKHETSESGFFVASEDGDIVIKYDAEGLDVAKISPRLASLLSNSRNELLYVAEPGFFIIDDNNNIGIKVTEEGVFGYNMSSEAVTSYNNVNIPRIYISSDALTVSGNTIVGLNLDKNEVDCNIKYVDKSYSFEEAGVIAYQGNTSVLNHEKKGFSLDTENKHRFNDWLEFDGFHMKAYYGDWTHTRDLCANRLLEQFYLNRPSYIKRPYQKYNDFSATYLNKVQGGAKCHVDGFPIRLYINDTYWGLYSLNIKKDRDNFLLSKSNVNHIQIEAANDMTYTTAGLNWTKLEIRNPKSDSGNVEFFENVEPLPGEVKTAFVQFIANLTAINSGTTKSELEGFLNVDEWIDAIIFHQLTGNIDVFSKNELYTTWDGGGHWSPLMYDMDISLGINNIYGSSAFLPNYDVYNFKAYTYCPWLVHLKSILDSDIKSRYAYLRSLKVIDTDNIFSIYEGFSLEVGFDEYKKDVARWPSYPSLTFESFERIYEWIKDRVIWMDVLMNYNI